MSARAGARESWTAEVERGRAASLEVERVDVTRRRESILAVVVRSSALGELRILELCEASKELRVVR